MKHLKDNIFVQFSVISFVVMATIAVTLTIILSNAIKSNAIDVVINEAVASSSDTLLNAITPSDLEVPMTGEQYNKFYKFVQESIVSERTVRVKIWAKDGTIIYSDEPATVGTKFPNNESLLAAMRGETAGVIKVPNELENEQERLLGNELIEVYTPIIFPGTTEPEGVFEIYQSFEPTAQLISNLRSWTIASIGIGFLVFYAALIGIVRRGWRTIIRQRERRQQAEEKLRDLYELEKVLRLKLEDELRKRMEFSHALVHELKTPLTPIVASSGLLADQLKEQPFLDIARNICRGAAKLNKRIDELLDLARSELGQLKLEFKQVSPLNLLIRVYEETLPMFSSHRQSLVLDLPSSLQMVYADETRLRQILLNFLTNASKFSPEGGKINLKAREKDGTLTVDIQDAGLGMTKEDMQRIFDPYSRKRSNKERLSGLGLGLALCKHIVELHGGKISVSSYKDIGTIFSFSIPLDSTN